MKTLILALFIFSLNAYSSDGAYECSSSQRLDFNSLGSKLINATSYVEKAKEMEFKGDKLTLMKQLNSAEDILSKFQKKLKESKFCYSLKSQANYLSLTANKLKIKISVHKERIHSYNSCFFSYQKLKINFNKFRAPSSLIHKSYLEISKTLNRTNILISSNKCSKEQKKKLFSFFDTQSNELEKLYKKIKASKIEAKSS
jgi:hypothetical protein